MSGLIDDSAAAGRGIALMIAGVFTVSVMDAVIKWLSAGFPSIQIIFFRAGFGLIPLLVIVAFTGGFVVLRTRRWRAHLARAAVGTGAMLCFFFALAKLELAEVVTLAFASPLFAAALSVPILGEKVGVRRLTAILVGFVGVVIIVRPGSEVFSPYAILPIAASFCFALGMVLARRMSDTESSVSIVFYTSVAALIVGAVGSTGVWITPQPGDWPVLVALGVLGGVGQYLMTSAFRFAAAAIIAPFEYSAMLWAVLFGALFWGEMPDAMTFAGGALVAAAGLFIGYRETRPKAKESSGKTLESSSA